MARRCGNTPGPATPRLASATCLILPVRSFRRKVAELRAELLREKHRNEREEGRYREDAGATFATVEDTPPTPPVPVQGITKLETAPGGHRVICPTVAGTTPSTPECTAIWCRSTATSRLRRSSIG